MNQDSNIEKILQFLKSKKQELSNIKGFSFNIPFDKEEVKETVVFNEKDSNTLTLTKETKTKEAEAAKEIVRTKERIKKTGEVFTPLPLVDEVLSKLPKEVWEDPTKTFIDPACGDGNFLTRVIAWKIEHGSTIQQALETTYGVDLMEDNIRACKDRLLALADDYDKEIFGLNKAKEKYGHIIDKNIVCANSLEYSFEFK